MYSTSVAATTAQPAGNGPSTGHNGFETMDHYVKSTKEHVALLTAIAERDEKTSRSIMEKHISRSMKNIELIMQRMHGNATEEN